MAESSRLPGHTRRLHALQWRALTERLGFTGEHLKWHESPERRRQAARPNISFAPPPATDLNSNRFAQSVQHVGTHGERITHDEWETIQQEAWAARQSDPVVIDSIGIRETISLAEVRFIEVAGDCLTVWATETKRDSEEFEQSLHQLRQAVGREVADVWHNDEWHTAWFERACRSEIDESLAALQREWVSRARRLEIQCLKNPHRSIESLIAEEGQVSVASSVTKSKKSRKPLQEYLSSLPSPELLPGTKGQVEAGLQLAEHGASQYGSVIGTEGSIHTTRVPRRTPDLEKSRERLAFLESIATELVTIKQDLHGHCTAKSLTKKHPRFVVLGLISKQELQELVDGEAFSPKTYAENLTLRKFGITSRATLKKDRNKIKRAER